MEDYFHQGEVFESMSKFLYNMKLSSRNTTHLQSHNLIQS